MANAIDDTASYARVYQTVMTADKRRRSRSVETWTGFPIPRTLLQPIISDGQLENLTAVSPSIDDGFEIKKDDENDPKFGAYEYFRASSTGEKPRSNLFARRSENSPALQDSLPEHT